MNMQIQSQNANVFLQLLASNSKKNNMVFSMQE